MMIFAVISMLIGMVLGQRFKVLVLLPAVAIVLPLTIAMEVARADPPGPIALISIAVIASLQIGYLVGTGIRHFVVAARASRRRGTAFPSFTTGAVPRPIRPFSR